MTSYSFFPGFIDYTLTARIAGELPHSNISIRTVLDVGLRYGIAWF